MKFVETIFGKKLVEITLEDLRLFFAIEREESSKIEFKSGEVEIEDVFREVCAFLNTDGGIIIIGAPRERKIEINKKNYKRVCVGELTTSNFRNKGWIIQKIAANISPYPSEIEIHEILTPEGNYFILDVPQSMTPPHQCLNEGKYYIRLDEEAKPAPHGIVQSLFFLRQKPKISTKTELTKLNDRPLDEHEIKINISNDSEIPTDNISYIVNIRNVKKIISEDYHENSHNFKKKPNGDFIIQGTINQVLIKRLLLPIEFFVVHKNEPFIISILVWGKDFGLHEDSFLWNPVEFKLIEGFKTGEGKEIEFNDLVDMLDEILKKTPYNTR